MKKLSNPPVNKKRLKTSALVASGVIATGAIAGVAIALSQNGNSSASSDDAQARIAAQSVVDPIAGKLPVDVSATNLSIQRGLSINYTTRKVITYVDQNSNLTTGGEISASYSGTTSWSSAAQWEPRIRTNNSANTALSGVTEDYASFLKPGFNVNDGSWPSNLFLSHGTFLTWLNGGYENVPESSLQAYDANTEQMTSFPLGNRLPNWKGIGRDAFSTRWISTSNKYYPANTAAERIQPANMPLMPSGYPGLATRRWVDISPYITRLKALNVTGNTRKLVADDFKKLVDEIGLVQGSDPGNEGIRIFAYDADNKPDNILSLTPNVLPDKLKNSRKIEFAIYGNNGWRTNDPQLNLLRDRDPSLLNKTMIGNMFADRPNGVLRDNYYTFQWDGASRDDIKLALDIKTADLAQYATGYLTGPMHNLKARSFSELRTAYNDSGDYDGTVSDPNRNVVDIYFALERSPLDDPDDLLINREYMPAFVMRDYLANKLRINSFGSLYSTDFGPTHTAADDPYRKIGQTVPQTERTTFGFNPPASGVASPIFEGFKRTDVGRSFLRWKPLIVGDKYYSEDSFEESGNYVPVSAMEMSKDNVLTLPNGVDNNQIYTYINTQPVLDNFNTERIRLYGNADQVQVLFTDETLIDWLKNNTRKIELQYRTTAAANSGVNLQWNRFPMRQTAQLADNIRGFIPAAAGTYGILDFSAEQAGDYKDNFDILFRIVATTDENGKSYEIPVWPGGNSTITTALFNAGVFVYTPDTYNAPIPNNGQGQQVAKKITDRQNLQVTTKSAYLDNAAYKKATGNSHDITISGAPQALIESWLNDDNRSRSDPTKEQDPNFNGWSRTAIPGYGVTTNKDDSLSTRYYFNQTDFKSWLSGNATTAMRVYDTTIYQYVNLPSDALTPSWNSLNIKTFSTRWIPTSDLYVVSDAKAVALDTSELSFWADMSSFLDSLKTMFIRGDVAHLASADFGKVSADLTTTFGAGKVRIELTSDFPEIVTQADIANRFKATPNFSNTSNLAYNAMAVRVNGSLFQINSWLQLGFRIVPLPTTTNFISSSRLFSSDTNVAGNWTPLSVTQYGNNGANIYDSLKLYANVESAALDTIRRNTILSGNTRDLSYAFPFSAPRDAIYDTGANGLLRTSGSMSVDIWGKPNNAAQAADELRRPLTSFVRINSTSTLGLNRNWMPLAIMKEYLAGRLIFLNNQVYLKNVTANISLAQLFPQFFDATGSPAAYASQGVVANFGFNASNINPPTFDGNWGQGTVEARIVVDANYVSNLSESQRLFTPAINSLYTAQDITALVAFFKRASSPLAADGVTYRYSAIPPATGTYGSFVSFPEAFMKLYRDSGLQLQYSSRGEKDVPADPNESPHLATNAQWTDANLRTLSAAEAFWYQDMPNAFGFGQDYIPGTLGVFLAFRLVPIRSDTGTSITSASQQDASFYEDATHKRLFVSDGNEVDRPFVNPISYYPVLSALPRTSIIVTGINLSAITASGNTRKIAFGGEQDAIDRVDALNSDKTLDSRLRFLYTIDLADGSFINGDSLSATALWLNSEDFKAYLNGDLIVVNNRVVYRTNNSRVVAAFTDEIINARNLRNGAIVTPDYFKINTITGQFGEPNRRNSIFVKWSTVNNAYEEDAVYIPSSIAPAALSYSIQTLKRWLPGQTFKDEIAKLVVKGNTKNWELDYENAIAIQASTLLTLRLKLQYSLDDTPGSWSDVKFDFKDLTWVQKQARKFKIRVVPIGFTGNGVVNNQGLTTADDNIYIDYTTINAAADPKTDSLETQSNDRLFKVNVDVTNTVLADLKISGNSFILGDNTLDESKIDTGVDNFAQIEIQYLFNNRWYNRADLLLAMETVRTLALSSSDASAAYKVPTDFTKTTLQARWRVLDKVNYYIDNQVVEIVPNTQVEQAVTTGTQIDKTDFRTFVSLWDVQDRITGTFRTALVLNGKTGEEALIRLTGSSDKLDGKFLISQLPGYANFLIDRGIKIQFSIIESPNGALNSADWKNVSPTLSGEDFLDDEALGATRSLWIRFVPIDSRADQVVLSNYAGNGLTVPAVISAIKLDTSSLGGSVTSDSSVLTNLVVSGDTQSNFAAATDNYLVPRLLSPGVWGVTGITPPVTVTLSTQDEAKTWFESLGLQISYRVTATRTKGTYVAGQQYTFNSLKLLKDALDTTNLNFTDSNLEVRWYATNNDFQLSDQNWVKPVVTALTNVVYTEDTFTLTGRTYTLSGNNLKVDSPSLSNEVDPVRGLAASFVLTAAKLAALGLKIQFNITNLNGSPDASKWSDTSFASGLNKDRDYWIRYAPISTKFSLATNLVNKTGAQVSKLIVNAVKVAIPFSDYDTTAKVLAKFRAAALTGKTYDFTWSANGLVTNNLPTIYASADSVVHGKIQYSIDGGTTFYDTLAGAFANTDYYNINVLGFDKDRGDSFTVRYAFVTTNATQSPIVSDAYVYTDAEGNELTMTDLVRTISIDSLVQPVLTTQTLQKLTGNSSIVISDGSGGTVKTPNGGNDFASVTWLDIANSALFTPRFGPSNRARELAFQYMQYDNKLRAGTNDYLFNLGQNPFNRNLFETKTDLTALAPRHTYFEFRTRDSATGVWTSWSRTAPTNVTAATAFDSFGVRLVADSNYDLSGWTTPSTFFDGSARAVTTIGTQTWEKTYPAAIVVTTRGISLPTVAGQQASFIGFDDIALPSATFLTTDLSGNHNPSNNVANLRDIVVSILDSGSPMNFKTKDNMYVLEWSVRDALGNNIIWTDSRGTSAMGWHFAGLTGVETDIPNNDIPWYGAYPVSLKNGDLIQVRLRAREGYEIEGDTLSSDYSTTTLRSRWSRALSFAAVRGLTKKIVLPTGFNFFSKIKGDDTTSIDLYGQPINIDETMPIVAFSGNGGAGKLQIFNPDLLPDYTIEVAVLRPINGEVDLDSQAPTVGYALETFLDQQGPTGRTTIIYTRPGAGVSGGFVANWQNLVNWVLPGDITDLSVGDALVFRLRAKTGAGFAWENGSNDFIDVNFPKEYSSGRYGTNLGPIPVGKTNLNMTSNTGTPPLPVRGLLTRPPVNLSELDLVYSENPLLRLNGIDNYVTLSTINGSRDIWRWEYELTPQGGTPGAWTELNTRFPSTLRNGDTIRVRAKAVGGSALDAAYDNTPVSFTVDELLDVLDASNIGRPIMSFSGYEGLGYINEFYNSLGQGNRGPQWSAPTATYPLGRPVLTTENDIPGELIWEFQVLSEDPATAASDVLAALRWSATLPATLKYNDYVRVRVGAVKANTIALANKNFVYGQNLTTPSDTGWTKVENLLLNPRNIKYGVVVTGTLGDTKVTSRIVEDNLDSNAVTAEFQLVRADGTLSAWLDEESNPTLFDETFGALRNDVKINLRVKAKPGYRMDPADANLLAGETVEVVPVNGVSTYYLTKDAWARTIDFLQINVLTTGVTLSRLEIVPMANNPEPNGIREGFATIKPVTFSNEDSITDAQFNSVDYKGNNYKDAVRIRYFVRALDPLTGVPKTDSTEIAFPLLPDVLNNGDIVIAELVSTNPEYRLSDSKRIQIVVTGLITRVAEGVTNPQLLFSGKPFLDATNPATGTPSVVNAAPARTRWAFYVVRKNEVTVDPITGRPIIPVALTESFWTSVQDPTNDKWYYNSAPTDLDNGDYVVAVLVPGTRGGQIDVRNVTGGGVPETQIPRSADWVLVTGLVREVNLAGYNFNLYDANNPYDPLSEITDSNKINFAFKLVGRYQNSAYLATNSPLYSLDPASRNKVLVTRENGEPLPDTINQKVQFGFAVSDSNNPTSPLVYTTDFPTKLRNNQWIHVILMAKPGVNDVRIIGYESQSFQVYGLDEEPSIANKTVTLIASIAAGVGALGLATLAVILIRRRRRKLYFPDNV